MASAALAGEVVAIAGEGNTDKLALEFNMLEEDQQNDVLSLKQDALYHALLRVRGALWEPLQPCSYEASTSIASSGFVAAADYAASRSGVAVLVPAATLSTSNGQQEQLQQQEQLHRNAPGIYGTPAVISGGVVGPRVGVFLRCMYTPALTLATRCGAPHLLLTPLLRREIPSLKVLTFPASDAAYLLPLYRSWWSQHEPVQQQQPPQDFHHHSTPQQQQAQQQHWQRQQQQKEGELKEKNFREGGHVFFSPPVCDMRGFVCHLTAADVLPQHATELTPDDVSATRSSPRGRQQMTTAAAATVRPEASVMPSASVSSVGPNLAAGVPASAAAPHLPPAGDVNEGPQQQQEENARLLTKKSMRVKGGCSSTDYTARGDNLPNNSNSSNSNSRSNSRSSSSSREGGTSAATEHDACGVCGSRGQQQRQERERATGEDSSGAGQGGRQAGRVGGRGTPVERRAEAHLEVRCSSGKVELTGRLLAAAATALQAHVVTAPCGEIQHQQPAVTAACWSSNDVSIIIKNSTHCSSENSSVHEAVVCDRGRGVGQQRQPQQQEQQDYEHRGKENDIHAQTEKRKTQELQQQQHVNAVRDWRWRGIAQKRDRKTLQTGEDILVDLLLHLRSEGKRRLPASFASELLRGTQAACGSSSCCDNAPHHSRGSTCRDNIDSEGNKNGSVSSNSSAKNNSSNSSDLQGDGGHCGVLCCCHLGPPYVHGDPEIHWLQQQQESSIDTSGDAAAQQRGRPVHASAASASSDSDSRRGSLLLPPRIPHVVATLQGGSSLPLREYISKRFQQLLLLLSPQQQQQEQQQQQHQQDSVALNGDPTAGASVRRTAAYYSPAAASCTGDSTSALPPPPPAAAAVNVAAQCGVSGVLVGGISAAACLEERHLLFAAALQHVPVSLPRFVSLREQAGGPLEILHAFCCGADVVEAAAVYVHSNQGLMYAFNPLLLIEEEPCCVGRTGNNSSSNETGSYDEDNSRISSSGNSKDSNSNSRRETPREEGFRGKTETGDTAEAAAAARHLLETAVKQRGPLQFLHSNLNEMLHRDDLTPLCAVTTSPLPSWSSSNGHRKRSSHSSCCTETDIEISDLSSSVRSSSSGVSETGDSNRIVSGSTVRESRAYIHHLLQTREMSGPALLLQHNLQILEALAFCFRTALQQRRLLSFVQAFLTRCCFPSSPSPSPPAPLLQRDPTAAAATDQ